MWKVTWRMWWTRCGPLVTMNKTNWHSKWSNWRENWFILGFIPSVTFWGWPKPCSTYWIASQIWMLKRENYPWGKLIVRIIYHHWFYLTIYLTISHLPNIAANRRRTRKYQLNLKIQSLKIPKDIWKINFQKSITANF